MPSLSVSDSDAGSAADRDVRLLTGQGHQPYHPTPGPFPKPPPGPRAHRQFTVTGGASHGHRV